MEKIIKELHRLLISKKKTLAAAESCTGGLFAKLLTDIPGSSAYFSFGVITYSNKSKEALLGIPHGLLLRKGAVSREVAMLMSLKVRRKAKTDLGVGITGIAGPSGGTGLKRTGTVYISASSKDTRLCRKFLFKGNRSSVRKKAALQAAFLLKRLIK